MYSSFLFYAGLIIYCGLTANAVEPGPEVIATKGGVWPKPKNIRREPVFLTLTSEFKFQVTGNRCSILDQAIDRYKDLIFKHYKIKPSISQDQDELLSLRIDLKTPCTDGMRINDTSDESYQLKVGYDKESILEANSVWGILRGLETFSQLLYKHNTKLLINYVRIDDAPRFAYRGLMLDTSRHFIPVEKITKILDGMVYNKLNVFHWHIIDDQAFPYQSVKFPELSLKGSYNPFFLIYTVGDVKKIIEYARLRGIRVIVEIDTPGHTRSWGQSHPELLSKCIVDGSWTGQYGPFDPTVDSLYPFLEQFFEEIFEVFPDSYLHIGADEIDYTCWKNHKHIDDFIHHNNLKNYTGLEYYHFKKLFNILDKYDRNYIAWEELFFSNGHKFKNMTYQTWIGVDSAYRTTERITKAGHKVIFSSSSWYLSQLVTGGDWEKLYNTDPHYIKGSDKQKARIIGGTACMWSENVDATNVLTRIWPRACAVAEKLWSPLDAEVYHEAAQRLEEHACRMIQRGVPTQPPNGPGFCL